MQKHPCNSQPKYISSYILTLSLSKTIFFLLSVFPTKCNHQLFYCFAFDSLSTSQPVSSFSVPLPFEQLAGGKGGCWGFFAHNIPEHGWGLSLTFGWLGSATELPAASGHGQAGDQRTNPASKAAAHCADLSKTFPPTTLKIQRKDRAVQLPSMQESKLPPRALVLPALQMWLRTAEEAQPGAWATPHSTLKGTWFYFSFLTRAPGLSMNIFQWNQALAEVWICRSAGL